MVIGNGMIAQAFASYRTKDEFVIFASGVSNSTNTDITQFDREKKLLTDTLKTAQRKTLVYFSTCSITDLSLQNSAYVKHKQLMEDLIAQNSSYYLIFRLTNPVGKTDNSHTVLNYFIERIVKKQPFRAWENASRNIIDIDDMFIICNEILQKRLFSNTIVTIANPYNYEVAQIISAIEEHFNARGNYTWIDKGGSPLHDTEAIESLFTKFNINFDEQYLPKLLKKYFPLT